MKYSVPCWLAIIAMFGGYAWLCIELIRLQGRGPRRVAWLAGSILALYLSPIAGLWALIMLLSRYFGSLFETAANTLFLCAAAGLPLLLVRALPERAVSLLGLLALLWGGFAGSVVRLDRFPGSLEWICAAAAVMFMGMLLWQTVIAAKTTPLRSLCVMAVQTAWMVLVLTMMFGDQCAYK